MRVEAHDMSMDERKKRIIELVERFEKNISFYKSDDYNEAQCRNDYINPLLECLGWDVRNQKGATPSRREVIVEDRVSVNESTNKKHPDYSLCYGATPVIYVEAKKPKVNLYEDPEPAYQVRRYGWNSKMPFVILTDFEEFVVYDTKTMPKPGDNSYVSRIDYLNFKEYPDKLETLYNRFSWNAVDIGDFDLFKDETKDKRGTGTVDKHILAMIEKWREMLAQDIAKNNESLDEFNLTSAVQKLVDRILFIRICEDKEIEPTNTLKIIADNKKDIYNKLINVFNREDDKFNSGLFQSIEWLNNLIINDKVLCDIINELYYPLNPYEFSVIPIEILGSIYEHFLGKIITFDRKTRYGHSIKVVENPEVKKAGGVYYTPSYIVKYIVENTIGETIRGKTPDEISSLRFVDPACGSGSFLVGAFNYLLDYHLNWYTANDKRIKDAENSDVIYRDSKTKEYKLSVTEKKRILVNNIYGVDIDAQAVEVTKLSLFLQLLENEGRELSENGQISLFRGSSQNHILPNLSSNIKCGNSLIGTDYYLGKDLNLFGIKEQRKINAFDWHTQFPDIVKLDPFKKKETNEECGFDCVIGNPPYYNIQKLGQGSTEIEYIKKKYNEVYQDKSDILFYFLDLALRLSKNCVGYIVSNSFLFSDKGQRLRKRILDDKRLYRIANFENYYVFNGVGITTCVSLFKKNTLEFTAMSIRNPLLSETEVEHILHDNSQYHHVLLNPDDVFALITDEQRSLNKKIDQSCKDSKKKQVLSLRDACFIGKGMETAADDVFLFNEYPDQFPREFIKKRITGINNKYATTQNKDQYVLYYENIDEFVNLPKSIQEYLNCHKRELSDRATCKNEGRVWWRYSRPMHKELYNLPKLYCSRRSLSNVFCYDDGFDRLAFSNMTVIFETKPEEFNLKYILTLLNSRLLTFRYRSIGKQTGGGSYEYFPNGVGKLPIKPISIEEQKPFIDKADQMIEAMKQLHEAKTESDKLFIQQKITLLERQIDSMVYELYGIIDDRDIALIESLT